MDGAIHHPAACGCDGNDMEVRTKMVQDELAIIATSVHEETIMVLSKLTTFNKVPTCRWHNVQSMAQLLSSQPVIIVWGILTAISKKAQARPQVPTPNYISFQAQVTIWASCLPC
jgi:hypothetical protein